MAVAEMAFLTAVGTFLTQQAQVHPKPVQAGMVEPESQGEMPAVVLALGVSVAVQVVPPSLEARLDSTPLGAVRSAVVKPVTASLKVKVTVAVSPILSAVSEIVMLEANVGAVVSMTIAWLAPNEFR